MSPTQEKSPPEPDPGAQDRAIQLITAANALADATAETTNALFDTVHSSGPESVLESVEIALEDLERALTTLQSIQSELREVVKSQKSNNGGGGSE